MQVSSMKISDCGLMHRWFGSEDLGYTRRVAQLPVVFCKLPVYNLLEISVSRLKETEWNLVV
jgi:hypothetical protein